MNIRAIFAAIAGLAIAAAQPGYGQANTPAQRFDVASVKPCGPSDNAVPRNLFGGTPGRVILTCMTVMALINQAYVLYENGTLNLPGGRLLPIEKGPAWTASERYTIEAKADGAAGQGAMLGPMLQALLVDRFKLKMHFETREIPVFVLTVAKGGPMLQAAQAGSCVPLDIDRPLPVPAPGQAPLPICSMPRITNDQFEVRGVTMAQFSAALSRVLGRDIVDKTGIEGVYDIRAAVPGMGGLLGPPAPPPPPGAQGGPSPAPGPQLGSSNDPGDFLNAAQSVAQKLGLKLEAGKGPGRFLVIEGVERPSPN